MAVAFEPMIIYINGYPGVGKLSVARALCNLLPNAKLFDNHSLIDATSMLFERSMPEYQPLRQQMRQAVLNSIATSESTKDITWVFTDQQSSSINGSVAAKDYAAAADLRGSPFVSIILHCRLEENIKRLTSSSRGVHNTKLTDVNILRHIRETEDIYRFGGTLELVVDVSEKSETLAAEEIKKFLDTKGSSLAV